MQRHNISRFVGDLIQVVLTFGFLGILVFPFVWIIMTSIRPSTEILSDTFKFIPNTITAQNYQALSHSDFPLYIRNSLTVSIPATALSVLVSLLAAYSFYGCD